MADEPVVAERGLLAVPDAVWGLAVRRAAVIGPLARAESSGWARWTRPPRSWGSRGGRCTCCCVGGGRARGGVGSDPGPLQCGSGWAASAGRGRGGDPGCAASAVPDPAEEDGRRGAPGDRAGLPCAGPAGAVAGGGGATDRRCSTRWQESRAGRARTQRGRWRSAGGLPPPVTGVLEQVQIDHTVVDLVVVDEQHRLPIGRPYVTVGDRRVQPVRRRAGGHVGGAVGDLGRVVPGAHGHRQAGLAGAPGRRGGVADERQARRAVRRQRRGVPE